MKRAVSIALVALLMLNVLGYYGIFLGLKYKHAARVTHRIENELYDDSETVTLKIPLSIPYFGDTEFERVDGEIQHDGRVYRLIKQKLEKDTLHVVCIRDERATKIHQALEDYVRTFTDQSPEHPSGKASQPFIKDYFASSFQVELAATGWTRSLSFNNSGGCVSNAYGRLLAPPPKA